MESACERNSSAANCISVRFSFLKCSATGRERERGVECRCRIQTYLRPLLQRVHHLAHLKYIFWLLCGSVVWCCDGCQREPEACLTANDLYEYIYISSPHAVKHHNWTASIYTTRTHACLMCNEVLSSDTLISALRELPRAQRTKSWKICVFTIPELKSRFNLADHYASYIYMFVCTHSLCALNILYLGIWPAAQHICILCSGFVSSEWDAALLLLTQSANTKPCVVNWFADCAAAAEVSAS